MFRFTRRLALGIAALAALTLGASAVAGAAGSSTTSTSTTGPTGHPPPAFNGPRPGTAAHEGAEKPVTGAAAAKAQAAAVKSVGSGAAGAVTTDFGGRGYETTVTKPDGTKLEVHLDSSFNVITGPRGGPGCGPPPAGGASPPSGSGASSSSGSGA